MQSLFPQGMFDEMDRC